MDLWSRGPPRSLGPLGLPGPALQHPRPLPPPLPLTVITSYLCQIWKHLLVLLRSRVKSRISATVKSRWREPIFSFPPANTSVVCSLRACWFRTNIGYQSHLAACRLFSLSYILGLVKPPAIKHTLLQSRAPFSPLSAPTRVHKLLGCAHRVTAFIGAKEGKSTFVLFLYRFVFFFMSLGLNMFYFKTVLILMI